MNKNANSIDLDDESVISRVSAWKNKDEFNMVYEWLFGSNSSNETKQLAYTRMKLWKMRRINLTPASILSTMLILDVQLKDQCDKRFSDDELRSMYSNAFTRFVNYMSSIMRSRNSQSMYSTARDLGIEPFLVDLRHLCAHGQVLPSLELSRRTTDYCMNWLRKFYWDRERNFITDACVKDVRLKSSLELEQSICEWFKLYDAATEAMICGAKNIDDLKQFKQNESIHGDCIELLQNVGQKMRQYRLKFLANEAINELAFLSNRNDRDRGDAQIYCDVLFDCDYFMKRSAKYLTTTNKDEKMKFIGIHQNLFRMLAMCDFINATFMRLINVCEDIFEDDVRKQAASFWAQEIATGFLVFKEFKLLYKKKKEKSSKFDVDLAPINTDIMTDDLKKIYKELGVNCRGVLVFGDTVRRPWSLQFDSDFLIERATNINEYTVNIIKQCIQLIEPSLSESEIRYIERLISVYMEPDTSKSSNCNGNKSHGNDIVHTINDFPNEMTKTTEPTTAANADNSIWREAPDGLNWKSCPIGSLP